MKLTLSNQLLLRTPAIPVSQTLAESFEELKDKIAESSPSFHTLIKDLHPNDLPNQPEKIQFTLWKYFNRAKYRATPFGSFAAITLLPITYQTHPPILQNKLITHRWPDWSQASIFSKNTFTQSTQLLTNSSVYSIEDQIRYLHQHNEKFELATIQSTPVINTILQTCKTKCPAQDLYPLLKHTHSLTKQTITKLLNQLINLQLLHTNLQPNLTGKDYFQRLNLSSPPSPQDYIISERTVESGSFDGRALKHLSSYIDFLSTHIQPLAPQALRTFIQDFQTRYEGRQIPLTQLMDPEIGLGYGKSEQSQAATQAQNYHTNPTQTTNPDYPTQQDQPNQTPTYPYTKLQHFLLQKLISGGPIDLVELQVEQTIQQNQLNRTNPLKSSTLPNTLSAVFHLYKDNIVLSDLGGATATALLGRFTPCSGELESYARNLAQIEQQANPQIILFDIAYRCETAVDNINRRKQLYPCELPLLCWSEATQPLTLADILVTVEQGQVILLSKSLGKRLVPRIPSAYNYLRSNLPVYRFLCDIQSQGLLANFHFRLKDRFAGLPYYPRVTYKNLIVSPARWLIPSAQLQSPETLATWLAQQSLTQLLKAGTSDQNLYFDPSKKQDIWALWQYCKPQQGPCYLTEALLSPESLLADRHANTYPAQYVASLCHCEEIYQGANLQPQPSPELYLPGSDWLYAKLYCHPQASNPLLSGLVAKLVKEHRSHLKKWFFIRYQDPRHHLRLRLQLKHQADYPTLLTALQQALTQPVQRGTVSEFSLHPYAPELHRYGATRMERVEEFFAVDSSYVLQVISSTAEHSSLLAIALNDLTLWCSIALEKHQAQHTFAKNMFAHFAREFQLNSDGFKQLNADFSVFKKRAGQPEVGVSTALVQKRIRAFRRVMQTCENNAIAERMLADLFHMHINRMFTSEQRWHEMLLYHRLQRTTARSSSNGDT